LRRAGVEDAESESERRGVVERVGSEYELDLGTWTAPPAGVAAGPGRLAELEDVDFEGEEGQVSDEAIVTRAVEGPGPGAGSPPASRQERRERLRLLQEKLRSLGPVNLLAMQDYEERRQRL